MDLSEFAAKYDTPVMPKMPTMEVHLPEIHAPAFIGGGPLRRVAAPPVPQDKLTNLWKEAKGGHAVPPAASSAPAKFRGVRSCRATERAFRIRLTFGSPFAAWLRECEQGAVLPARLVL
eukprot:CAMPEP_0174836678 /NCGR_PEP_ID=MMETSP1114-20130205/6231_1 /TAXON_ID=312471 /ORGANISM="Neobodo designis, Strain CCAP 1951/1" /LENGTH=118 /DNA_ID=CAMNT_0016070685 /DNA_START=89 /DNA_END=446 /DNA_ORIENTATION=+